jgi:hypothetical protein
MHRANFRLELLEDRFLLSGGAQTDASDQSDGKAQPPAETSSGLSGSNSNSQSSSQPDQSSNAGGTGGQNAGSSATNDPSAAGQQTSNETSSNNQEPANVPDVVGQNQQVYSSASVNTGAGSSGVGSICSGGATSLQSTGPGMPASPVGSSSSQALSISVPLPIPLGVPAGGVFNQIAANSAGAGVAPLSPDPVAVDLSAPHSTSLVATGSLTAFHASQPSFIAAQSAANGFGSARSSLRLTLTQAPKAARVETAARAHGQRADLPDVAALVGAPVSIRAVADQSEIPMMSPRADAGTEPPAELQTMVAQTEFALGANQINLLEDPEADLDTTPAHVAIYSAASLTLGLTTPGLTTMMRRLNKRDNRRPLRRQTTRSR